MRDFLNAILAFIGAESLSDVEFAAVESTVASYTQATYDDLAAVLSGREAVSTLQDRLVAYYEARGVEVEAAETGRSNIFLGSVLE